MKRIIIITFTVLLLAAIILGGCAKPAPTPAPAPAPKTEVKAPEAFTMMVLPSGSIGYSMMVGVAKAIQEKTGVPLRVIPAGTDVARLLPTTRGDTQFSLLVAPSTYHMALGLGSTYSNEEWGPQAIRLVWEGTTGGTGWPVRGDSGIKTGYDLKGKRIGVVPGHPMFEATPWSTQAACLAFFNLTWKDVIPVPVASSTAGYKAILEGGIDTMFLDVQAAGAYELEGSKFGIWHCPFPKDDVEGWKRLTKIAPYIYPLSLTGGTGPQFAGGKSLDVCCFGYDIISYPALSNDIAYLFAKGMWEGYDIYKDTHPNLPTWTHERCLAYKTLYLPYHDGTVKFFKDIGVWIPQMEEFQNNQVKLEKARQAAWWQAKDEAAKQNIKQSTPEFSDFWRKWLMDNNLITYPQF